MIVSVAAAFPLLSWEHTLCPLNYFIPLFLQQKKLYIHTMLMFPAFLFLFLSFFIHSVVYQDGFYGAEIYVSAFPLPFQLLRFVLIL